MNNNNRIKPFLFADEAASLVGAIGNVIILDGEVMPIKNIVASYTSMSGESRSAVVGVFQGSDLLEGTTFSYLRGAQSFLESMSVEEGITEEIIDDLLKGINKLVKEQLITHFIG